MLLDLPPIAVGAKKHILRYSAGGTIPAEFDRRASFVWLYKKDTPVEGNRMLRNWSLDATSLTLRGTGTYRTVGGISIRRDHPNQEWEVVDGGDATYKEVTDNLKALLIGNDEKTGFLEPGNQARQTDVSEVDRGVKVDFLIPQVRTTAGDDRQWAAESHCIRVEIPPLDCCLFEAEVRGDGAGRRRVVWRLVDGHLDAENLAPRPPDPTDTTRHGELVWLPAEPPRIDEVPVTREKYDARIRERRAELQGQQLSERGKGGIRETLRDEFLNPQASEPKEFENAPPQ